jgi:ABC-type uncharacterized transport system substrate-binding protein
MRRRQFIAGLGSAAAWPLAARAQQPAMPVIGYLHVSFPQQDAAVAFRKGLGEVGYVEGRNVTVEYRWAEEQYDRLPALAADLVRRRVNVLAAPGGSPAAIAAKAVTTTIPVVFFVGTDPVEMGLVTSLSRPSGNLTGVTYLALELGPKRLEQLHELVPTASVIGALVNPSRASSEAETRDLQVAALKLGLQLHVLHASTEHDFDMVFVKFKQARVGAVVISGDPFFNSRSEQLGGLTFRHAIPTVYQNREFAVAGGLMSYGGNFMEAHRQVGVYAGRILKGETPSDLPVQRATKIEMVVNLKTAKALGLEVPTAILVRADEVIE